MKLSPRANVVKGTSTREVWQEMWDAGMLVRGRSDWHPGEKQGKLTEREMEVLLQLRKAGSGSHLGVRYLVFGSACGQSGRLAGVARRQNDCRLRELRPTGNLETAFGD